MRSMSLLLFPFFSLHSANAFTQSKWSVNDKAIIAGYLANPGCEFSRDLKAKCFSYHNFYCNQYLVKDSIMLAEKMRDILNLFFFFVLDKQNGIIDSVNLTANDIRKNERYFWTGTFENMRNQELDAKNKLLLLKRALAFPAKVLINDGVIIFEFDLNKCTIGKEFNEYGIYARTLAWVIKDYIMSDTKEFKSLRVYYKKGKGAETCYVDLNNSPIFNSMYKNMFQEIPVNK